MEDDHPYLKGKEEEINEIIKKGKSITLPILAKGIKNNPLPPDNMKTVKQLENLKSWSVDPLKYVENINQGKS